MSAGGQVGLIAQDAVRTPDDEVRGTRRDVAAAPGAHVGLGRLGGGDGLDGPFDAAADLAALPAGHQPLESLVAWLLGASTVRPGHGCQYQPTRVEWSHAPHGVP
jgi:hypothetical protein